MLVVLYFECMECAFGRLGKIGLPKLNIELVYKITPITPNQRFWVSDEDGFPPEHDNVGEITGCV